MSLNVPTGTLAVEFADSKNTYSFIEFAKMSSSPGEFMRRREFITAIAGAAIALARAAGAQQPKVQTGWRSRACRSWMATILEDVSGGFA
jgi:hypothetical protein